MLYSPVHGAEEGAAVLHQAVEVHLLQEVTLGLAEVVGVEPLGQTVRDAEVSIASQPPRSDAGLKSPAASSKTVFFTDQRGFPLVSVAMYLRRLCLQRRY